jgi:FkbM family methyltransferase
MKAITTLCNKSRGLVETLCFSNWPELLLHRAFSRDPFLLYRWQKRWSILCDTRRDDHQNVKEILAQCAYEPFFDRLERELRRPVDSYVNVGANIGVFDIYTASRSLAPSELRGIAIELHPHTAIRLAFNLLANDLAHVHPIAGAITDYCGTARFTPSGNSRVEHLSSSKSKALSPPADRAVEIPALTIAALLESHRDRIPSQIDLLKLDCEGAEFEIVPSLPRTVIARFRSILMETHSTQKAHTDPLEQCLLGHRFNKVLSIPSSDSTSLDLWLHQPEPNL